MIVLYSSPGCASCRKVRKFLKDNGHEFIDKNIFTTLLNEKEIKYLLSRTENGSDDLISKRSKIIMENKIDIDSMSTSELISFIKNNPSVLRRPIIIDVNNFQVGYDEEEIEIFNKAKQLAKCDKNCSHYSTCGALREEVE